MTNMWSDKKYINIIINILLFLMGINFMHIGQLLLPIVCLILFIDNKFRLKINNYFIFIILCLFALTFCIFSYKLGFYCFIGFCLPMAYYIGCNLNTSEDNIKKLIYIIAFGMASHLVLDFIFESFLFDFDYQRIFGKVSHYDIWISINTLLRGDELYINGRIKTTVLSLNYILILACFFYLFVFEDNKKLKISGISLFILSSIYCLALGRRTTFLLFIIVLFISLIYYFIYIKKINVKNFVKYIFLLLSILVLSIIAVYLNLFDVKTNLSRITLFAKIFRQGFDSGRISIFIESIKYYTQYLWGGQKISESVGFLIHNMWGDIYDYAGIVPFILMIIYTISSVMVGIKFIKNKAISTSFKLVIINLYICSFMVMLLEPLLSAFSLLLIVIILLISSFDTYNNLVSRG